jgi:glycerophosphoryl diester phosphodiesterase
LRRRRAARKWAAVLQGGPLLIAHRGGAALAPENTLVAFRQAAERWRADMIEFDVRASADGRCVVMHDPTVDRTTNGTGAVGALTLSQLRALDAGFHFTADGGRTYPFRDSGARVPTIDEVFEALPQMRFTIEVKIATAQQPLFDAIRAHGMRERVIIASERNAARTLFHTYDGVISASVEQCLPFWILHRCGLGFLHGVPADVVQLPLYHRGRRVVSKRMVRDLHAHGLPAHVWTVNDREEMERLLDWGVDGILTDRPDLLAAVLREKYDRERRHAG